MSKMNGFQLYEILKKIDNNFKTLFCSAFEANKELLTLLNAIQNENNIDLDTEAILLENSRGCLLVDLGSTFETLGIKEDKWTKQCAPIISKK